MRTNWEQLKERIELKIGEAIDKDAFTILANEAIMDLNEVAYIEAPVKRYLENDILDEDEYYEATLEEMLNGTAIDSNGIVGVILPFEYNEGYNELEFYVNPVNNVDLDVEINEASSAKGVNDLFEIKFKKQGDILDIQNGTMSDDFKNSTIKVVKRMIRLSDEKQTFTNEMIIELPQNFSSMIKLEAYSKDGVIYKCQSTSINSFDIDSEDKNLKGSDVIYYVHGLQVHIFTAIQVKEFRLYFTRRMAQVDKNIAFTTQYVELEQNFENMLTFLICHKWLENFVGTEDSETNNMFQKYQTLKQEYMLKNLPKRTKRRQSNISIK